MFLLCVKFMYCSPFLSPLELPICTERETEGDRDGRLWKIGIWCRVHECDLRDGGSGVVIAGEIVNRNSFSRASNR